MFKEIFESKKPTVKEFKYLIKNIAKEYTSLSSIDYGVRSVEVTLDNNYDKFKEKIKNTKMYQNGFLKLEDIGGTVKILSISLKK